MSKFDSVYNNIKRALISEVVSSEIMKINCGRPFLDISILDHEKDRQVRISPCFTVKLNSSDTRKKKLESS